MILSSDDVLDLEEIPESMTIVGAGGMGKTALALNIARNAAVSEDTPVAVFSIEMSKE